MKTLCRHKGMFGAITVCEDQTTRSLYIDNELQGRVYLDSKKQPGVVAACNSVLTWLIAGFHHPQGRALMVGLGCGAGVISLLAEFKELQITVVEIDPVIIEIAQEYFPLLRDYQAQGRLTIVNQDIRDFIASNTQRYPFICLDVFFGAEIPAIIARDFFRELAQFSDDLWINLIGSYYDSFVRKIAEMDELISLVFPISLDPETNRSQNWMLSSVKTISSTLLDYQPYQYSGLVDQKLDKAFKRILGNIPAGIFYDGT